MVFCVHLGLSQQSIVGNRGFGAISSPAICVFRQLQFDGRSQRLDYCSVHALPDERHVPRHDGSTETLETECCWPRWGDAEVERGVCLSGATPGIGLR